MTAKGGRPRTFPPGAVEIALERRERTGETWAELALDLKVSPGTLRARVADHRRETRAHKTPALSSDELPPPIRSSERAEAEIVIETFRPPTLCPTCGMVHSPVVPCP